MRWVFALGLTLAWVGAYAQCFTTTVTSPTPFMGNHGEVFRTGEGAVYEVIGAYEYLYAYYPEAAICPDRGVMMVEGAVIQILPVQPARRSPGSRGEKGVRGKQEPLHSSAPISVVLRVRGCDYFIADGPRGYYLLEWYGGYDPEEGDGLFGDVSGYGFKDVLYAGGQDGRVYVDDYLLGRDRALEKLADKCD